MEALAPEPARYLRRFSRSGSRPRSEPCEGLHPGTGTPARSSGVGRGCAIGNLQVVVGIANLAPARILTRMGNLTSYFYRSGGARASRGAAVAGNRGGDIEDKTVKLHPSLQ